MFGVGLVVEKRERLEMQLQRAHLSIPHSR